jgi:hypothetical protein
VSEGPAAAAPVPGLRTQRSVRLVSPGQAGVREQQPTPCRHLLVPTPPFSVCFPCRPSLLAPVQAGDRPLCVLNTHLFYHYMAPHIRTMHVWVMLQVRSPVLRRAVLRRAVLWRAVP